VCFDFNSTNGGWTAGGYADWQWGYPTYVFDGNAWETILGGYYYNNACGWLDSPAINFGSEGGWVTFDSYNYIECDYDGWNLQISLDDGASWSVVYPLEGYDQGVPYGAYYCPEFLNGDSNCGYGEVEQWNFDLTGMPNVSVMFRIAFTSDSNVASYGMVMDNFCVHGGSAPSVMVQCQLLNPDMDGDGIRDVHVGEYMYYSATFLNLTTAPVEYGAMSFWYALDSCPDPYSPENCRGPVCKGTLLVNEVKTHYYRIGIPNVPNLVEFNPFAWEVAAWQCIDGEPQFETDRCCFDVILLPPWEPPPVPEPGEDFIVEEIYEMPVF
jgi:hypothetical protein